MKRPLSILALFLAMTMAAAAQVGKQAPPFSLENTEGKTVKLEDLKGKVIVLNFWATWCPPCRAEIPDFIKVYDKYKSKGVEILGVSLDHKGWEVVRPFVKSNKINYPVLLGDQRIAQAYGNIRSIPTTFIIDRKGKVVDQHVGAMSEKDLVKLFEKLL
ncbi:MAG TPA: TlpA disulfide reductase family protein [Bacteroidota bacterium]|jgi:cytochrome c biogenesis protein CcmG/thiol:disulfide interchange protein DsbE|nr:TlpA disulfide reductase family protein [Bacteroidota bacterium]